MAEFTTKYGTFDDLNVITQYGIFNDLSKQEIADLPSTFKYQADRLGVPIMDWTKAIDRVVDINHHRQLTRDSQKPLAIDMIVGREVTVKVRKRTAIYSEWEDA